MKKYLNIFILSAKSQLASSSAIRSIFEYSLYFVLLVFIFSNAKIFSVASQGELYFISGVYVLLIFLYRYFYENALVVRYLLITDSFDRVLVKPINPLFRILIDKIDLAGLLIAISTLFGLIYFDSFKYSLLIISGLIISFAIFVLVISLLIITSGKLSVEKLLLSLFLLGLIGMATKIGILSVVLLSMILLFISFKLWNLALNKYTSASS